MKTKIILLSAIVATSLCFAGCSSDDNENTTLQDITVSKNSVSLQPQSVETLTLQFFPESTPNKNVTWTSSDNSIATVDDNGVVTAVKVGTATITVTSAADATIKKSCEVNVAMNVLSAVSGTVRGTWAKFTTVSVDGHIRVPAGETLIIEEGVEVIFSENGVGASKTGIEFMVEGNLYCKGTAENPVLFTVAPALRTYENTFKGIWGGIVGTSTCAEMLFDHCIIEYTGSPVVADSPSAIAQIYTAGGDITPHITTYNSQGKYIVQNCILRNGCSDALYFMGGSAIIINNTMYAIGETGAEAINMKAGCKVDACYNLIFAPNTNGLKLSSSGQDDAAGRTQCQVRAYNNTIINSGWRRNGVKGGGMFIEKGALVGVFNNLEVNCKFRAMTPSWNNPSPTAGADQKSVIDYNFYASGSQKSTLEQDVNANTTTSYLGYTSVQSNYWHDGRNDTPIVDAHSIVSGSAGDATKDPKFINYGFNTVPLDSYQFDPNWDFHVQAGSPVLTGACSTFTGSYTGLFSTAGLTVNGTTYKSQAPSARFGAFGTN